MAIALIVVFVLTMLTMVSMAAYEVYDHKRYEQKRKQITDDDIYVC